MFYCHPMFTGLEENSTAAHPLRRRSVRRSEMTITRAAAILLLYAGLGTSILCAGDFSSYRGLRFGMDLPTAAKLAGMKPSEARLVHQRPAVIQELDWQPGSPALADPLREGLLCFYNGELFRMVVTYDRYRIEGMTAEDLTEAISATYGMATKPTTEITFHSNYAEVASVMARWEDSEYSYNLVRTGDGSSFAMVLYSKRVNALAEASNVEALRLEAQEAPQKAIDLQKKKDDEKRLELEKARSVNKPNFRP
jgi:hypothetical protein